MPLTPWAHMRKHGPCMIFEWHATEEEARKAIDLAAKKHGQQVYKFHTVAYFPSEDVAVTGEAEHFYSAHPTYYLPEPLCP